MRLLLSGRGNQGTKYLASPINFSVAILFCDFGQNAHPFAHQSVRILKEADQWRVLTGNKGFDDSSNHSTTRGTLRVLARVNGFVPAKTFRGDSFAPFAFLRLPEFINGRMIKAE